MKSVVIPSLEYAGEVNTGRQPEGNQGIGNSSDESGESHPRTFAAHQQCNGKGRVGHTITKKIEVAVQGAEIERHEAAEIAKKREDESKP